MMAHPYQVLTPSVVLDALSGLGLAVDGRLSALSSYENRVYLAHLDDDTSVVAKFYRPGRWSEAQIREEHSFTAELVAEDIPVVGPLVLNSMSLHEARVVHDGVDGHFWFSVSPRRGGRAPELDDPEVLMWIGRLMARMHLVGERHAFSVRPVLNLHTFGEQSREQLVSQQQIAEEVQQQWLSLCDQALALVKQQMPQDLKVLRLHGDCHPGNILWTPEGMPEPGPHFVDMDDARTGPAVQDLWMLVHGDIAERRQRMEIVLEGYESVRGFDRRELQCIEPLRTLRIIHYSAWLAGRQDDPAFPLHFPWFGTSDYWRGQCDTLKEQIEAMQTDDATVSTSSLGL
ncbi:MAG: serine/threonine protein kinase [Betaproteobacteria bacterium]|nr:serine/threonine protein kinase [Betaproteobacteria bacterium]